MRRGGGFGRRLRVLTGLLAGGLVVLLIALGVAWFVAGRAGAPGPGPGLLAWHAVAAVVAVLAQRHADRRPGRDGTPAALAVLGVTVAVLAFLWIG